MRRAYGAATGAGAFDFLAYRGFVAGAACTGAWISLGMVSPMMGETGACPDVAVGVAGWAATWMGDSVLMYFSGLTAFSGAPDGLTPPTQPYVRPAAGRKQRTLCRWLRIHCTHLGSPKTGGWADLFLENHAYYL